MEPKILLHKAVYSEKMLEEAKRREDICFDDDTWVFFDEFRNKGTSYKFNNKYGIYKDMVKVWCLARLDAGVSYQRQKRQLADLLNIMNDSDYLSDISIETILGNEKSAWSSRSATFTSFADFIGEFAEEAKDVSSYVSICRGQMRELSSQQSFIKLDYIINDFIKIASEEELTAYYPIVIWWKLGTIIPIRPEEFCMLKRDCLSMRNGFHYIELATAKKLYEREPVYSDMAISEELYNLISDYLERVDYDPRKFIFSEIEARKIMGSVRVSVTEVNVEILSRLLNKFYIEICEKRMGMTVVPKGEYYDDDDVIEKMTLGDLRPFAMYNMMAQGLDPYAIKRMARHSKISSQTAYYPNMQNMALGKVHAMAKRVRMRLPETVFLNVSNTLDERQLLARQIKNNGGIKICNGECSNNMNCPPDVKCIMCQHYLPYDKSECKEEYEKEMHALEQCIDTMVMIYKERMGNYDLLKSLAKEQNTRINRAAILEARCEQTM